MATNVILSRELKNTSAGGFFLGFFLFFISPQNEATAKGAAFSIQLLVPGSFTERFFFSAFHFRRRRFPGSTGPYITRIRASVIWVGLCVRARACVRACVYICGRARGLAGLYVRG